MEEFLIRGWDPILRAVRWLYIQAPVNQQSASGAGVSTPCGAVSTRGIIVFGFMIREWHPIVPGWRWLYPRAPANQRSAGAVGVSTPCGAVSTKFSSPGCRSYRCMEGSLNQGWGSIPGCGEVVAFPRGETHAGCAAPLRWPRVNGGTASTNGIGARKTLG